MTAAHAEPPGPADKLPDHPKAARDFAFEGTKLGTSIKDFLKQYPDATENPKETDAKLKTICYVEKAEAATSCGYIFFDGTLYEMEILYNAEAINKIGGATDQRGRIQSRSARLSL